MFQPIRPRIGISMDYQLTSQAPRGVHRVPQGYVEAIWSADGHPVLMPCGPAGEDPEAWLGDVQGLVLIGGKDYPADVYGGDEHPRVQPLHPLRVQSDLALAKEALLRDLPILAICGGHQLVSIACGGKIIPHLSTAATHQQLSPADYREHDARITGGKILRRLFAEPLIRVNSSHHQAVDPEHIGAGLVIAARAPDGVVEALEGTHARFLLAVQWHPECIDDAAHRRAVFGALIDACQD